MTDLSSRKILGLNQQTYQRLRLALSLHLRRQIFIAVCDDLELRDRLAARLIDDLTPASTKQSTGDLSGASSPLPRLVSLSLNLTDPHPIAQIADWLSQALTTWKGDRRFSVPAFQLVGIEHLTHAPATTQQLFFTHLQGIERSLPALESSLILWMPQPWFRALPQSAPEFWRCRTAVFEFVGDPTPLPASIPHPEVASRPPKPKGKPVQEDAIADSSPTEPPLSWTLLTHTVVHPHEPDFEHPDEAEPQDQRILQPVGARISTPVQVVDAPPKVGVKPILKARRPQPLPVSPLTQATQTSENATKINSGSVTVPTQPIAVQKPSTSPALLLGGEPDSGALQPATLLRQIELLQQQSAPPSALAEAYRMLGNLYRDRIEQGETSSQNLTAAIQSYEQVLVWLHETSPVWTDVLNDLGNLYWMLSRHATQPDQALASLQQGIQAYQLALAKLDLQTQTHAHSMIQNNLGAAYADLARFQDAADNLQRSIQAYRQALQHRKAEVEPQRYASTQNNLGTTYWNLAQHQQPEVYLKQAIAAYSEALTYYTPDREPMSYAMIQNNLGTAYWNLAQHERPLDWLRLALSAYTIALRYRTLDAAPAAFAATQNNLGTAYWHMANHSKDNTEQRLAYLYQAIGAYEATLVAIDRLSTQAAGTPLNFDRFATYNNLGLAHYQLATDTHLELTTAEQSYHLQNSLQHHLQAVAGWQEKPEFRQTAISCVVQIMRAIYNQCGLNEQNVALSCIPGSLLAEILPKL